METTGLNVTKPHKGKITVFSKLPYGKAGDKYGDQVHLGYGYAVRFWDHPYFRGQTGHVSLVVKEDGDEIETLNSRYTVLR